MKVLLLNTFFDLEQLEFQNLMEVRFRLFIYDAKSLSIKELNYY